MPKTLHTLKKNAAGLLTQPHRFCYKRAICVSRIMNWIRNHLFWVCWILLTVSVGSYLTFSLLTDENRGIFLPGETSHGHYQIEKRCETCHTPMMGVKQEACLECHAEELNIANDTHPEKKFTDPRNADRVAILDARKCITCHVEHEPDMTQSMGLTQPNDYCFRCHADIWVERPSHKALGFDTCASAGCHNFHDNRALYEDFLSNHLDEPDILDEATVPAPNMAEIRQLLAGITPTPLRAVAQDAPIEIDVDGTLLREWERTTHAHVGVNCQDCHMQKDVWKNELTHEACRTCHNSEVDGFLGGRHGMRLAQALSPMTPSIARLPMKPAAHDQNLTCVSCHSSHAFDRAYAAVDACLSCHNDTHSLAYTDSPHFALWEAETDGAGEVGSGVSCATCHLPREMHTQGGIEQIVVEHNQNDNLRPNEKMIRNVCMNCHGLGFSINALADLMLIENNFNGTPSQQIRSLDMVKQRLKRRIE